MKVICIDANKNPISTHTPPFKEGDTLTAAQCPVYHDHYDILEHPTESGIPISWGKYRFIPISTIDETESETYKNLSHAIQ